MAGKTRAERLQVQVPADMFRRFANDQGAWHETAEEVQAALAWGADKAVLLAWVRKEMARSLTERERHCVTLVFFEGLTYREAAARTATHASSVHRAVARGIAKLRHAAAEDPVRARWKRPAGRGAQEA